MFLPLYSSLLSFHCDIDQFLAFYIYIYIHGNQIIYTNLLLRRKVSRNPPKFFHRSCNSACTACSGWRCHIPAPPAQGIITLNPRNRYKNLSNTATAIPFIYYFSGNSAASAPISTFMCLSDLNIPRISRRLYIWNWDWGPDIPFLGIFVSNFRLFVFAVKSTGFLSVSDFLFILSFSMHTFIITFKQHIHPFLLAEASLHFPHCSMLMCSVGKPLHGCGAYNWNRNSQHTFKWDTLHPALFKVVFAFEKKEWKAHLISFIPHPPAIFCWL